MRRASVLVLVALCLVLAQCGGSNTLPGGGATSSGKTLGQNLLVEASGTLAYKHPGWNEYSPLTFGIALVRGDLMQVASDGTGLLVCADLSLVPLEPNYLGGVPCPERNQVLTRGDSLVVAPQRGAPTGDSIPMLLQPRHTFVRDARPLIRWTATASDAIYTVRVWGSGLDWQTQTSELELRYPEHAPALAPGVTYRVTVVDDAGHSSDQEVTALDLGFVLLSDDDIAAIDALVQQADALGLDRGAAALVEAEILVTKGLRADAITTLAGLAERDDAPSILERLGALYLEVGLYDESHECYQRALVGFQSLGIPARQAAALTGLAQAQLGVGDEALARLSLEQAVQLYQDLGADEELARVEQLLRDLGDR